MTKGRKHCIKNIKNKDPQYGLVWTRTAKTNGKNQRIGLTLHCSSSGTACTRPPPVSPAGHSSAVPWPPASTPPSPAGGLLDLLGLLDVS